MAVLQESYSLKAMVGDDSSSLQPTTVSGQGSAQPLKVSNHTPTNSEDKE
ncbi:hypothetical protein Fmac_004531 [Flemingia macrophylla]|uniref:Uncharacterized protein n=1 Tax=Flemingia macrophylla TaxID=520843 RepID=A0ABD1N5V0_9FABA